MRSKESTLIWKDLLFDNLSYKIVALFISLILWVTILGRRDVTLTRTLELDIQVNSRYQVQNQSVESVKVKAIGPRTALKKFIDSSVHQVISLDLSDKQEGLYEVEIPEGKVDVPFGVKIVSVKPQVIQVQINKKD